MTARASLRERLAAARAARFVDLPVRGLDGVHVRYKPVPADLWEKSRKRHARRDDSALRVAADVLIAGCVGVYEEVDGKGVPVVADGFDGLVDLQTRELTGDLPTFSDPELGVEVGATEQTAAAAVFALYSTDWDVITAADRVLLHSGLDDVEGSTRGN